MQIPDSFDINDAVDVRRSIFQPCSQLEQSLEQFINSLDTSCDFDMSLYKQCVSLVGDNVTLCPFCMC